MKKSLNQFLLAVTLSLSSMLAIAIESQDLPDIKPGIVSINILEPDHDVGYTVGDIITRNMVISIKKPYQLIDESLPIIGYERRYKGQLVGIDLSAISHTKKADGDKIIHTISLSYQVFTNNVVAKHGSLPQEYLRVINTESHGKEIVKYRIPSWDFGISPLSIFGQVKVEDDMSTFRGPLLISASNEDKRLKTLLIILGLSLVGLLYMLGKHAWLPRMGGPFAKSYREIRKLPNTPQAIQIAVSSMHQSLNKTAGYSLFAGNLEQFYAQKPAFKAIKTEMNQFFALSRQVFFEPMAQHEVGNNPVQWLAQFCRRCRDCERGLIPDSLSISAAPVTLVKQSKA